MEDKEKVGSQGRKQASRQGREEADKRSRQAGERGEICIAGGGRTLCRSSNEGGKMNLPGRNGEKRKEEKNSKDNSGGENA